jgi:hypothetical protein
LARENRGVNEPFFEFLGAIAVEGNECVHICPFPMEDCYDLVQSLNGAKRRPMFEKFPATQKVAEDRMYINQTATRITSDLSLRGIPELDELIDIVTRAVHDRLARRRINLYGGLASAAALPMPHREEGEDQNAGAIESVGPAVADYGLGQSRNKVVVEDTAIDATGLQAVALYSLGIRRPDARGKSLTKEGLTPREKVSEFSPSLLAPSEFEDIE